ncbi:hypothetical protein [Ekhidna sp. To15]|uniref:hypothetical protein n=1 Tax=Ekhidna sp. To15 TaxID=3395267 RepID=UPI003F522CCB
MAKLNEENLSKLSRKGMYSRMKELGSKSKGKIYTFKKATPEILMAIRQKRQAENQASKKKRMIIGSACVFFALILFWITMTL